MPQREVDACDIQTGNCAWRFPLGALPDKIIVARDDSGSSEIFIGTDAVDNGKRAGEFDDSLAYVIALSENGNLLWDKIVGGRFSTANIFPTDIDNDGKENLCCVLSSGNNRVEPSFVVLFDPHNGREETERRYFPEGLATVHFSVPVVKSGHENVMVLCTRTGDIEQLNSDLHIMSHFLTGLSIDHEEMFGLNREGHKDFLFTLKNNNMVMLDDAFQPIAMLPVDLFLENIADVTIPRDPLIQRENVAITVEAAGQIRTYIGHWEKNPSLYSRWIEWTLWIFFSAALLAAILYSLYRTVFYFRLYKTATKGDHSLAALVLNRRGIILHTNDAFESLFDGPADKFKRKQYTAAFQQDKQKLISDFLAEALHSGDQVEGRIDISSHDVSKNILARSSPVTVGRIRLGTLVVLTNITATLRTDRMINWALVAHNLAHEMKTPLSTIWFTLERIKQTSSENGGHVEDKYLESVGEELRRLDGYVKGFMKLANLNPPNMQVCNFNNTLNDFLDAYKTKLPETISIQKDFENDLPGIKLDVNLFTVALTNLLDNAVIAMQGKGTVKLSTFLVRGLNTPHVCLTVSDTGCGIAPEDIPKIFNPYFSTSGGGTGLGTRYHKENY